MKKMQRQDIFDHLRIMAEDVAPIRSAKIAAAVVYRDKIMSLGVNQLHTHPFQAKFGANSESMFWHAETKAIFNALKIHEPEYLSRCDLYVVRVKRPSSRSKEYVLGSAKPCVGCQRCITDFGIRNVFYSTDSGFSA